MSNDREPMDLDDAARDPAAFVASMTARTTAERLFVRCMAGSCRNGFERDSGRLYHAIRWGADPSYTAVPALCGRRPGRRSAGWSQASAPGVTCPRCRKKAATISDTVCELRAANTQEPTCVGEEL